MHHRAHRQQGEDKDNTKPPAKQRNHQSSPQHPEAVAAAANIYQLRIQLIFIGCILFSLTHHHAALKSIREEGQQQPQDFPDAVPASPRRSSTTTTTATTGLPTTTATTHHQGDNDGGYTMWSNEEGFFHECRSRILWNDAFGQPRAPFVDKLRAKDLVREVMGDSVQIVPTIVHYNETTLSSEFTLEKMQNMPQPYIIKATHESGGIARVINETYECFKSCLREVKKVGVVPLGKEAWEIAMQQMKHDLNRDFGALKGEKQYSFVPHRIMIEEHLPTEVAKHPVAWMVVHGQPVLALLECPPQPGTTTRSRHEFLAVSTRFEKLDRMHELSGPCIDSIEKPDTWDDMLAIVTKLGQHVPPGFVRIDLYADHTAVYFSEFTFHPLACRADFEPRVLDGLFYAMLLGQIDPSVVTAEYVEQTLSDTSWVLITRSNRMAMQLAKTFPSPVDLCLGLHEQQTAVTDDDSTTAVWSLTGRIWSLPSLTISPLYQACIHQAKQVAAFPLRCLVVEYDSQGEGGIVMRSFGVKHVAAFDAAMKRVNWGKATALLIAIAVLTRYRQGVDPHDKSLIVTYARYIGLIIGLLTLVTYVVAPLAGFSAPASIASMCAASYETFAALHPVSSAWSPLILHSHLCIYWIHVASWQAKSVRNLLVWLLLVETITAFVDEYAHQFIHEPNDMRCLRMDAMSNNNVASALLYNPMHHVIQEYILPPLLVYLYLLPEFVFHWTYVFVDWLLSFE